MKLKALEGKAILQLAPSLEVNSNGMIIPKQFRKKTVKATVIGETDIDGIDEGDTVYLAPDSGYAVDYEGTEYVVVQKYEILVKLK